METEENKLKAQVEVPLSAVAFGYAGAIPFVVAATAMWFVQEPVTSQIHAALVGFGLVILSFMGGIRWGLAMRAPADGEPTFVMVGISVVPAFVAWLVFLAGVFLGPTVTVKIVQTVVLILAFAVLLWVDFGLADKGGAPTWYRGLRLQLTLLVEASLITALARLLVI